MEINPRGHPTLVGIDDEVLGALTGQAVPFIDDPNAVLRRLLGLDVGNAHQNNGKAEISIPASTRTTAPAQKGSAKRRPPSGRSKVKPPRAPKGSLTPEEAFEQPILEVLEAAPDGQLPAREVVQEVGQRMGHVLNEHDRFTDDEGVSRWEKRVPFVRMRLVERGLLSKDAPRGVWEITDDGRAVVGAAR